MKVAFLLQGLPGLGYHGGAMTCWAIIKEMRARHHDVVVISLFDTSIENPYLRSRQEQVEALKQLGVETRFVDEDLPALQQRLRGHRISNILRRLFGTAQAQVQMFPWMLSKRKVRQILDEENPQALFIYHFDALAAVDDHLDIRTVAGVGDLWQEPLYFQWLARPFSIRKWTIDLWQLWTFVRLSKRSMKDMLRACETAGAFAAHYADWLRDAFGVSVDYWRTPVADVLDANWRETKTRAIHEKPTVVMVGDLGSTSTSSGIPFVSSHLIPRLDQEFGRTGYQLRLVGSLNGLSPAHVEELQKHPSVVFLGRIVPADPEILGAHVMVVPTPIPLGIRVRIITGLSLGTAIVTHRANSLGIPELKHQQNCLIGDDNTELADHVVLALKDRSTRMRLEASARALYVTAFSEPVAGGVIVDAVVGHSPPAGVRETLFLTSK